MKNNIKFNFKPILESLNLLKGINPLNILNVTIKDLRGFFDGMYGYLLLSILLIIIYTIFMQTFFIAGVASTRQLFEMLPIYMVIFIPAITMTSFAKESEKQTLEFLTTKPLHILDITLGKIFASTLFTFIGILFTLPLPFFISTIGRIDIGETINGYIGAFLLILSLSSIGVMISSFFKNQIAAYLTSLAVIFTLFMAGTALTTSNINQDIANVIAQIGITTYYSSIIRGVLDISDVLYFIIVTLFGIAVTYTNLLSVRVSNIKNVYNKAIFSIGAVFLLTFWMVYSTKYLSIRADITSSQKYTLSNATKEVIKKPGKVKIDVYASSDSPQQFKYNFDEVKYLLADYKAFGGNNIEINYIDPKGIETQLTQEGITPMQFNIIGDDQFQAKQAYLGMKISNESGEKKEVIPYINSVNGLEYQITRLVSKVKEITNKKLAFANGNGEYSRYDELSVLNQVLQDNFTVEDVYIPSNSVQKDTDKSKVALDLSQYSVLVIANPTSRYTDESITKIKDFLNNGGKVIFTADNIKIDGNAQITEYEEGQSAQGDLFKDLGVTVEQGIVYDLQSKATVTIASQNGLPINIPYSLFLITNQNSKKIESLSDKLFIPWGQSLLIEGSDWDIIYKTTSKAGILQTLNLDPAQSFAQDGLGQKNIVAMKNIGNGGELLALSTTRIFGNEYISNSETNLQFAIAISEHFGGQVKIAEIKSKDFYATQFTAIDNDQKTIIKFGAPIVSLLLVSSIGALMFTRKRLTEKKIYKSLSTSH